MPLSRHGALQRHSISKPARPSPLSDYNDCSSSTISTTPSITTSRKRDSQGNLISREDIEKGRVRRTSHTQRKQSLNTTTTSDDNDNNNNNNNNKKSKNNKNDNNNNNNNKDASLRPTTTNHENVTGGDTDNDNDNDNGSNNANGHEQEDSTSDSFEDDEDSDPGSDSGPDYTRQTIPPQLLEKLSTFPLFKNAPKAFHKAIAGRLKLMQHHAQEYIVKFGEPAKAMYWILRGSVAVTSPDGEAVHTELVPGQFFGEIGILFNRPRTATVIARTRVLLGVLTADNFNAVLPDFPRIERMIRDEAQERLAMQDKRKRNGVTNILPNLSSSLLDPAKDALGASASSVASAISVIPGPSIPPRVRSPSPGIHLPTLPLSHSIHQSVVVPKQVLDNLPPTLIENSRHLQQECKYLPKIHDNVDHSIPTRDFLRSLPMFTLLPSNMIHELVLGVEPKRYEPFEYIVKKGDIGRDIYFIVNGEVEVLDPKRISIVNQDEQTEKKVDKVLARLSTGQYFGEMAFLNSIQKDEDEEKTDPQRSADIRSISTVDLLVVTGDQLESLYSRYPRIVDEMQETANKRSDSNQADLDHDRRVFNSDIFNLNQQQQQQSQDSQYQFSSSASNHQQQSLRPDSPDPLQRTPSPSTQSDQFNLFNKWGGFGGSKFQQPSSLRSNEDNLGRNDEALPTSSLSKPPIMTSSYSSNSSACEIFSPSIYTAQAAGPSSTATSFAGPSTHKQYAVSVSSLSEDIRSKGRPSRMPMSTALPAVSSMPLQLNPPSMNPALPSTSQFPGCRPTTPFEYVNHAKRLRLNSIAGFRRRSSVLSTTALPDRLLLQVFKYLSLPELMKLRIICRRWRQLLYVAPGFFETLDLKPYNRSIDDKALIQITDFVGSRPKVIDISNCFHITDVGFCYMLNEIGMSGSIKILRMTSVWEVSAMAIMDVSVPSIGHHIEELDLSNCRKVRDDVIERIIGWWKGGVDMYPHHHQQQGKLAAGPNLHDLDTVPGMEEFDQQYQKVSKPTAGCQNIKILSLGYCKHLTDRTMYHIAMYASDKMESLDLTRCISITDVGFAYWAYQPFTKLRKLKLSDCTFLTDKSIIAIASSAINLRSLDLSFCCALSDVSIEVLCLGCPQLTHLDLSFCGSAVSDSTLLALSIHLSHLERLTIKGCIRVTRAGIDALLSSSLDLKYLDISQCRNAHVYRNNVPAAPINVMRGFRSAFVRNTVGNVVEIVI